MNLAIAVDEFDPDKGYLEYYLAKGFAERGHRVCVFTFARSRISSGVTQKEGFKIINIPCLAVLNGFHVPTITGVTNILKRVRLEKPDVIHCQPLSSPLSLLLISLRRLYSYRIVGSLITQEFSIEGIVKRLMYSLLNIVTRRYIKNRADLIFAKTDELARALAETCDIQSSKSIVVPLGADPNLFRFDATARRQLRKHLGLRANDVVIVYSGKINPSKDLDVLIRALAPIMIRYSAVRLLIVGKGEQPYMDYLRHLTIRLKISGKVTFCPWVHRTKLYAFYSASDIAVWPGVSSISIVEAASVGLPIIMTKFSVESYGIANGNGLTFKRGDVNELRSRLEVLVRDSRLREEMGRKSRLLVKRRLNWETIITQYLNAYANVLRKDNGLIQRFSSRRTKKVYSRMYSFKEG